MEQELPVDPESSLPTTHCVASDSDSDDSELVEQERKRLMRGRAYAKVARKKAKSKRQLLERQLAELTEEVGRLKVVAATATPSFTSSSYNRTLRFHLQKLATALSDPRTSDQEFIAVFDEIQSSFGLDAQQRMATIAKTCCSSAPMRYPRPNLNPRPMDHSFRSRV